MNLKQMYHVFLTAEGDNRGLYVASKTSAGFSIRESNGGHSTLAVEYRIVGYPYDSASMQRLAPITGPMPYANKNVSAHLSQVKAHSAKAQAELRSLVSTPPH